MTQEAAEMKLRQMQDNAKRLNEERSAKFLAKNEEEKEPEKKEAKFLKDMGKKSYLESEMGLDERINRNRHYIARDANRDE